MDRSDHTAVGSRGAGGRHPGDRPDPDPDPSEPLARKLVDMLRERAAARQAASVKAIVEMWEDGETDREPD